ncbi:hemolysin family protein [Oscillospiraceae bacterium 44-34]
MPEGPIWLILFFVSLCVNLIQLLWRPVLRLLRRKDQVSEDNIMAMVEEGEESGAIQSNEKEFIENVLEFDNTAAKDVMIHRTDMVTLPLDAGEEEILETIRQSGLSRFPVCGDDIDDIVGVLSTRDYLLNFREPEPKPLRELLRPAYFVPETVAADVLFRDMQGKKTHLALVVDEYGGTSGLVTLEDLLEELVGNIYDEFDPQEEQEIIRLDDGRWRVSGSADLEELAEAMDFQLPEDEAMDYDTLGGLVFSQLSVIPEDGSRPVVEALGLHIQVEELCDRRVEWALVKKLAPEPEKESE